MGIGFWSAQEIIGVIKSTKHDITMIMVGDEMMSNWHIKSQFHFFFFDFLLLLPVKSWANYVSSRQNSDHFCILWFNTRMVTGRRFSECTNVGDRVLQTWGAYHGLESWTSWRPILLLGKVLSTADTGSHYPMLRSPTFMPISSLFSITKSIHIHLFFHKFIANCPFVYSLSCTEYMEINIQPYTYLS